MHLGMCSTITWFIYKHSNPLDWMKQLMMWSLRTQVHLYLKQALVFVPLQVKLWYDKVGHQLIVTILGAKDLPSREDGRPRNPYVKIYFLPDRRWDWGSYFNANNTHCAKEKKFSVSSPHNSLWLCSEWHTTILYAIFTVYSAHSMQFLYAWFTTWQKCAVYKAQWYTEMFLFILVLVLVFIYS